MVHNYLSPRAGVVYGHKFLSTVVYLLYSPRTLLIIGKHTNTVVFIVNKVFYKKTCKVVYACKQGSL